MRRDLGFAAALTAAAVAASATSAPVMLTSALAIPALLVAPGYVWLSALVPQRTGTMTEAERGVLTVGLSLAILALGGLLMAAVRLPLERAGWLAMTAIAVAGGLAASLRGRRRGAADGDEVPVPAPQPRLKLRVRRPSRPAVLLTSAALLTGAAVATAFIGATSAPQTRFTSLAFTRASGHVMLRLENAEGSARNYLLVVTEPSGATQRATVTLPSGGSWQHDVGASAGTEANLYLVDGSGRTGASYRRVTLQSTFGSR